MNKPKFLIVLISLGIALSLCFIHFNSNTPSPTDNTTLINLKDTTAEFVGKNVNIMQDDYYGTIVEIKDSGTYMIQGSLKLGFISISENILNATIILNGVDIFSNHYAALIGLENSNITLILAENTTNILSDGSKDNKKKQPKATLLTQSDLTIKGAGKLIINGKRKNGIESHSNIKIESGEIEVNAVNDAIRAKKRLTINGGKINITKCYEGLESYDIDLNGGFVKIKSSDDGINISSGKRVGNVEAIPAGNLINVSSDSGGSVIKTLPILH